MDVFPADARAVESVSPVYETLPGWKEATSGRRLEDLPRPAVDYIRHLERLVSCPIHLVSLGPERSAMVRIPHGPASLMGA
jgi:adenylosuccinate synthase